MPALDAGPNIIGKVGIDQTTDGTTNAVNLKTSGGAGATIGVGTETPAVATEDNTSRTLVSLLKGIKNTLYVSMLGVLGATNGAKVVTDADGTVQQYLRGLVSLVAGILSVKIDQTTDGTTNAVNVKTSGGAGATIGVGTETPLVGTEDGTSRTLVSLLKGIKNTVYGILSVKIDQTTPGTTNGVDRRAIPSVAADNHAPVDNTSAVVTYGASAGVKHYLYDVFWSYDVTLTAVGTLAITDDGATVFGPLSITQPGPGFLHFDPPIVSSVANKAMVVTLTTGGALIQGALACRHEAK